MAYEPQHDNPEVIRGRAGLDHLQQLFLDAGRVLVLGGWLVVTYSFGNPAANAEHVFLGFALLLLGVFLLTASSAPYRFPGVARVGAAVANALLNYLFAPAN